MNRFPLILLAIIALGCDPTKMPPPRESAPQAQPRATTADRDLVKKAALRVFTPRVFPATASPMRAAAAQPTSDRRPWGRLDLANEDERLKEKGGDPDKNPRAYNGYWHRDANGKPLDARDADYPAKFAEAYKTRCIPPAVACAKKHGAQGLYIQDPEGRQYDQPVTYLGNWATCCPPEMTVELRRWTVRTCKENGLFFGCTVRPTAPVMLAHGNVKQKSLADPATAYIENLQEIRWMLGSDLESTFRLAYLDSNNEAGAWATGKGPLPFPASVLAKVQATVPNILLFPEWGTLAQRQNGVAHPEWGNAGYLVVPRVAPWRETSYPAHPTTLLAAKAGAFELMMPTPGWVPTADDKTRLVAERRAGHVFVFNATATAAYEDPGNALVDECEKRAAANEP